MNYNHNGKQIAIPDDELQGIINFCQCTQSEAITIWLEDNDYITDDNTNQMDVATQKIKDSGIMRTIHDTENKSKGKSKAKERKPDNIKREVITALHNALLAFDENATVRNIEKYIDFEIGGESYELNLIKHRKKKGE